MDVVWDVGVNAAKVFALESAAIILTLPIFWRRFERLLLEPDQPALRALGWPNSVLTAIFFFVSIATGFLIDSGRWWEATALTVASALVTGRIFLWAMETRTDLRSARKRRRQP